MLVRGFAHSNLDNARCGQRASEGSAHQRLMLVALRRDDLASARTELAAAAGLALAVGRPGMKMQAAYHLALLLAAQGVRDAAAQVMAFALRQPSAVGGARQAAEALLADWGGKLDAPWRGPPMDELVQRIALEAGETHTQLLVELRRG